LGGGDENILEVQMLILSTKRGIELHRTNFRNNSLEKGKKEVIKERAQAEWGKNCFKFNWKNN
jgi:hypothetical protein